MAGHTTMQGILISHLENLPVELSCFWADDIGAMEWGSSSPANIKAVKRSFSIKAYHLGS